MREKPVAPGQLTSNNVWSHTPMHASRPHEESQCIKYLFLYFYSYIIEPDATDD